MGWFGDTPEVGAIHEHHHMSRSERGCCRHLTRATEDIRDAWKNLSETHILRHIRRHIRRLSHTGTIPVLRETRRATRPQQQSISREFRCPAAVDVRLTGLRCAAHPSSRESVGVLTGQDPNNVERFAVRLECGMTVSVQSQNESTPHASPLTSHVPRPTPTAHSASRLITHSAQR